MENILYDFKDWLLGAELRLKDATWLNNIVLEYMYTKYQGGPLYHDHTSAISDHISGRDNYYNHSLFTGWQHWGMVMGNPLYMSPLYNDDGTIRVRNNRFVAWHLGLSGDPSEQLHYRVLATWQRGYGTYDALYRDPRKTVSMLAEAAQREPTVAPSTSTVATSRRLVPKTVPVSAVVRMPAAAPSSSTTER